MLVDYYARRSDTGSTGLPMIVGICVTNLSEIHYCLNTDKIYNNIGRNIDIKLV